jgi:hypothetical protein
MQQQPQTNCAQRNPSARFARKNHTASSQSASSAFPRALREKRVERREKKIIPHHHNQRHLRSRALCEKKESSVARKNHNASSQSASSAFPRALREISIERSEKKSYRIITISVICVPASHGKNEAASVSPFLNTTPSLLPQPFD